MQIQDSNMPKTEPAARPSERDLSSNAASGDPGSSSSRYATWHFMFTKPTLDGC